MIGFINQTTYPTKFMKNYINYITASIIVLLSQSCIKENFNNCPDWGKYKVAFYDSSSVECLSLNYVTLLYNGVDSISSPLFKKYFLTPYSPLIDSPSVLKLFPGSYNFCALLSNEEVILNKRVRLKNGFRYFYANTKNKIEKSALNKVPLIFNLANSMVVIKCSLDSNLNNCTVEQIAISPPEEKNAQLDISNGLCEYESHTTEYFENTTYHSNGQEWIFYCNPTVPGNDLIFKVTLQDIKSSTPKTLITKIFLETGLEQGKVYRFYLNVTPYKVEYMSSTITDWTDYFHTEEITL